MSINVLFFVLALSLVGAVRAALFQPAVPVLAAGLSAAAGLERPSCLGAAGVLVSVGGAVGLALVSTRGGAGAGSGGAGGGGGAGEDGPLGPLPRWLDRDLLGTMVLVAQVLAIASWSVVHRARIAGRYPVVLTTAAYYSIAAAFTAVAYLAAAAGAVAGAARGRPAPAGLLNAAAWTGPASVPVWGALLFAAFVATAGAYIGLVS